VSATIVHDGADTLLVVGETIKSEYRERFAEAMTLAGVSTHDVAKALKLSYQAIKKVLEGRSKMMAADNNVAAAKFMQVDSEWLATGVGQPRGGHVWPLSTELLAALDAADVATRRRAENAARSVFQDFEPLLRPGDVRDLGLAALGSRESRKHA
jgi:transcriptional regulator with XRE-family HTH domain